MDLQVRCSAAVTRLERLVGLVGGQVDNDGFVHSGLICFQGIGLELGPEPKEVVQHSFYRFGTVDILILTCTSGCQLRPANPRAVVMVETATTC